MKIMLSLGIGDAFCFDSLIDQNFRESITEIYWACKYGEPLSYLFANNFFYKNLKKQFFLKENDVKNFIEKKFGKDYQHHSNPHVCKFWHFKNDPSDWNHRNGYELAHQIFNLDENISFPNTTNFFKNKQSFKGSSFLNNCNINDFDWKFFNLKPNEYILVHQSSNNRPESDIASINNYDYEIIKNIAKEKNKKILIITDKRDLNIDLNDSCIINVFDLPIDKSLIMICALCKYCYSYIGLDSYIGILCSKVLNSDNLYIKSHDTNITNTLKHHILLQNYFLPNDIETIQKFYLHQKYNNQ